MTFSDWVSELYIALIRQGWTMSDIDDMDIEHFMRLEEYRYDKEYQKAVRQMTSV